MSRSTVLIAVLVLLFLPSDCLNAPPPSEIDRWYEWYSRLGDAIDKDESPIENFDKTMSAGNQKSSKNDKLSTRGGFYKRIWRMFKAYDNAIETIRAGILDIELELNRLEVEGEERGENSMMSLDLIKWSIYAYKELSKPENSFMVSGLRKVKLDKGISPQVEIVLKQLKTYFLDSKNKGFSRPKGKKILSPHENTMKWFRTQEKGLNYGSGTKCMYAKEHLNRFLEWIKALKVPYNKQMIEEMYKKIENRIWTDVSALMSSLSVQNSLARRGMCKTGDDWNDRRILFQVIMDKFNEPEIDDHGKTSLSGKDGKKAKRSIKKAKKIEQQNLETSSERWGQSEANPNIVSDWEMQDATTYNAARLF